MSDDLQDVHNRLHASSDAAERHTGFRLDTLTAELRRAARELGHTATELTRVHNIRSEVGRCQADWGVCPDHGNTITTSGGTSVCGVDGRSWDYDRLGRPCGEPATEVVTDLAGDTTRMCHGHALAARDNWHGAPRVAGSKAAGGAESMRNCSGR